ncbi:MAG: hypothetical protein U0990_05190 [Candidatus Nanopelagicales bacterium]|nr:hypothetical protein [Candidatus Nanopelagicales bacterium]MDZ4249469.1 hypothetical protein [Candidatus Nanopelagicales bacterium]
MNSEIPRQKSVFHVGISSTALGDISQNAALRRAVHEELLEDLTVHGCLVFTSREALGLFVAAVRCLPTSLSKMWEAVLSSRRVNVKVADPERDLALDDVLDPLALEAQLSSDVELVLLEGDQAELLGVPDDQFSTRTPGGLVEIGRLTTAGRTATVLAARHRLEAPLREGENREIEWDLRFGPLVEASRPIVIYDRYVGQQTARRYVYERGRGDGLTWFLSRVGMKPDPAATPASPREGRRVRIITTVEYEAQNGKVFDEDVVALAFARMLQSIGRDIRVDLVLVPSRTRDHAGRHVEKFGHDRHIRFGERAALALGTGMQAFSRPRFPETVAVAHLPVNDAKAREERAIRAALRPPSAGWLSAARDLSASGT